MKYDIKIYIRSETLSDGSEIWNIIIEPRSTPSFTLHVVNGEREAIAMAQELHATINDYAIESCKIEN